MPSMAHTHRSVIAPYEAQLLHQGPPDFYQDILSMDQRWFPDQDASAHDHAFGHGWCPVGDMPQSQCVNYSASSEARDFNHDQTAHFRRPGRGVIPAGYASSHDAAESVQSLSSPTFSAGSMNHSPAVYGEHPAISSSISQPLGQMVYHLDISHQAGQDTNWYPDYRMGAPAITQPLNQGSAVDHALQQHESSSCGHAAHQPLPLWTSFPEVMWHPQATGTEQSSLGYDNDKQHITKAQLSPLTISSIPKRNKRPTRSSTLIRGKARKMSKNKRHASPALSIGSVSSVTLTVAEDEEMDAVAAADEAAQLEYDDEDELAIGRQCINSRLHPIFAQPQQHVDGLFHCPFVHKGRCGHTPRALKCDYHKMVEAHIKQYRCLKDPVNCLKPMTSSAIRFRHEREQHESSKHKCLFDDCLRSQDGYGFPRAYNRNDHMRRAHDWEAETDKKKDKTITRPDRKKQRYSQKTAVQKRTLRNDTDAMKGAAPVKSPVPITAAPASTYIKPILGSATIAEATSRSSRSKAMDQAVAPIPIPLNVLASPTAWAPHVHDTTTNEIASHATFTDAPTLDLTTLPVDQQEHDAAHENWVTLHDHVMGLARRIWTWRHIDEMDQLVQQATALRDMARDIEARSHLPAATAAEPWMTGQW